MLRLLRGETVELLSREHGVRIFKLEQWRQRAEAVSTGLAASMQRIGELSMEVALRAKATSPGSS